MVGELTTEYQYTCICSLFNASATTEIYNLSLHDALPICRSSRSSPNLGCAQRRLRSETVLSFHSSLRSGTSPVPRRSNRNFIDRKSTRLNSSHSSISYAVFCLKKKNQLYFRKTHIFLRHI